MTSIDIPSSVRTYRMPSRTVPYRTMGDVLLFWAPFLAAVAVTRLLVVITRGSLLLLASDGGHNGRDQVTTFFETYKRTVVKLKLALSQLL